MRNNYEVKTTREWKRTPEEWRQMDNRTCVRGEDNRTSGKWYANINGVLIEAVPGKRLEWDGQ